MTADNNSSIFKDFYRGETPEPMTPAESEAVRMLQDYFKEALETRGCPDNLTKNLRLEFLKATYVPEKDTPPPPSLESFADGKPFYQMRLTSLSCTLDKADALVVMRLMFNRRGGLEIPFNEPLNYAENFRSAGNVTLLRAGMGFCTEIDHVLSEYMSLHPDANK